MKILRILVAIPLIAVLVIFALSNRAEVTLSFLGYEVASPLSVAILVAAAIAFLIGAIVMWFGELRQRRRARRAEQRVATLEAELQRVPLRAGSVEAPGALVARDVPGGPVARDVPSGVAARDVPVPATAPILSRAAPPLGLGAAAPMPVAASPGSGSGRP